MTTDVRSSVHVAAVLNQFLDNPGRRLYGLELMRTLDLGSGTLYPILGRLVTRGWLVAQLEQTNTDNPGRPPRRFYELTDDGRQAAMSFTGRVRNLRPGHVAPASVEVDEYCAWYAPGSVVAILEYLGHGLWDAEETTVVRVTKSQVFTTAGMVFWRRDLMRVGQITKQRAGIATRLFRLASRDNKHAVAELGPPAQPTPATEPAPADTPARRSA